MLQGAAADCNSAEATHAWFDSKIAHQFLDMSMLHLGACGADICANMKALSYWHKYPPRSVPPAGKGAAR
jgi:hypothetical protein